MKNAFLPLFVACLLPAVAAEPLVPGSPAPPLLSGEFVQGEPIKEFEKGKVYLLEFWATWCGPCVRVIPHVNELHQKYSDKGLVVIGQNVWERDETKVKPFIEKMGDQMTYRVAMDDKSDGGKGKMSEAWMVAAGQRGIPAAMIVNKEGILAWVGHPSGINDVLIEQMLDGTFDVDAFAESKKQASKNAALMGSFKSAMDANDTAKATEVVDEIVELNDASISQNVPLMRSAIAEETNPRFLETLARAKFVAGDQEGAISSQESAIKLTGNAQRKAKLEESLGAYQDGNLPPAPGR